MTNNYSLALLAFARAGVAVATLLVIAGCSPPATVITGLVSLDGAPLSQATLEFFPVSGRGKVSFATTDQTGRYRADVSPTKLTVVVTATKVGGKAPNPFDPNGEPIDRMVNAVPERFSYEEKTPLTADPVEGKTTTIDFALTSFEK